MSSSLGRRMGHGLRAEEGPELIDLPLKLAEVAVIGEHVVDELRFGLVTSLPVEAAAGIGLQAGDAVGREDGAGGGAIDVAGYFADLRGSDEDEAIEAVAPAVPGAAAVKGLEEKGGLDQDDGVGIAVGDGGGEFRLMVDDGGMDDSVELLDAAIHEGDTGESGAIEGAGWGENGRAEVVDDGGEDELARLHEVSTDGVCLKDVSTKVTEEPGDGGFAAAETAGEADAEHGESGRRTGLIAAARGGGRDGVLHEHGDGEGADAAGDGGISA